MRHLRAPALRSTCHIVQKQGASLQTRGAGLSCTNRSSSVKVPTTREKRDSVVPELKGFSIVVVTARSFSCLFRRRRDHSPDRILLPPSSRGRPLCQKEGTNLHFQ